MTANSSRAIISQIAQQVTEQGVVGHAVALERTLTSHSGPLPSPSDLAAYEQISPGIAKLLIQRVDTQMSFRHAQEAKFVDASIADAVANRKEPRIGQVCGLIIGLTCIIGAVVVIIAVPTAPGASVAAVMCGAGVGGLVTSFIIGQRAAAEPSKPEFPKVDTAGSAES